MLKWKILAVIGFTFGVASIMWGYAQDKTPGFYELRPDRSLRVLATPFFNGRFAITVTSARLSVTGINCSGAARIRASSGDAGTPRRLSR
jgi:hypothetical protein